MSKKILVVGGVAGGASAAARARRLDESAEIIMFERGHNVSFSNCCLPYHLSGTIEKSDDLVLISPQEFKDKYNIDARTRNEVIDIKREEKKVVVKDLEKDEEYEEDYDKLILSPGANPICPNSIPGVNNDNVFTVRNVQDIRRLNGYVEENDIQDIAVVGAGFIGCEVTENFKHAGKNVKLIEAQDQIMPPLDNDMAQILHKELYDNGVELILEDAVKEIKGNKVVLNSGKEVDAEAVVMAIGVCPETELAERAGLELGETGSIKVDHNYQTSDKDIYAVGDAIEVYCRLTKEKTRLPLAGPAQRQARAAADAIYDKDHTHNGIIGSSVVRIFDMNAASTGINEKQAQENGIPYDFVYVIPGDKVGLMPESYPMHFKLIYEYPTGKILGAQAVGRGNVDKRIDVIATMIHMDGTLEDLKELELCYAPVFGTAKDVVNHAALVGLNLLNNDFEQVPVTKVRELVENDAFIVDVREEDEFEEGHFKNAVNIPLSEFRDRLDEIPKDEPVYLHCRSGQRSYNVIRALQDRGYENVYNISGSFLGVCYYEYYLDQVTDREKIVTEYNFE
ncbi:MAG: FAD-dependent oxidoreductase [Bacillota bacterium]